MTPERLAEILASIDRGDTWDRTAADLARSLGESRTEIDRLRALPVIATCGECGHAPSRYARPRVCQHQALFDREDPALLTVEHADVPPAGCPLRGAR